MSTLLDIQGVSAGYGGEEVVRGVSLQVPGGELCALLGLNASGKTTLLRAVCGLIKPFQGRSVVNGVNVTALNEQKRARYVSYIPQRHSSMYGVSVLEAVLMGYTAQLGVFEAPSRGQRAAAQQALASVGLAEQAHSDFSKLSEGQKQMVILARALLQDAPVMLLDEPDSALDFLNRHAMMSRVRALVHEQGKAGLVTLHEPNTALEYCDRIVTLADGEIVCELALKDAGAPQLQACLAGLYGGIRILEDGGRFLVVREGE